mmetsp:Transcript_75562/g.167251  ORF Transcript_75562/g.167251 Transcript_75562/m.167251 type:complete len:85 (-) Transcript_75562:470-724(-)
MGEQVPPVMSDHPLGQNRSALLHDLGICDTLTVCESRGLPRQGNHSLSHYIIRCTATCIKVRHYRGAELIVKIQELPKLNTAMC